MGDWEKKRTRSTWPGSRQTSFSRRGDEILFDHLFQKSLLFAPPPRGSHDLRMAATFLVRASFSGRTAPAPQNRVLLQRSESSQDVLVPAVDLRLQPGPVAAESRAARPMGFSTDVALLADMDWRSERRSDPLPVLPPDVLHAGIVRRKTMNVDDQHSTEPSIQKEIHYTQHKSTKCHVNLYPRPGSINTYGNRPVNCCMERSDTIWIYFVLCYFGSLSSVNPLLSYSCRLCGANTKKGFDSRQWSEVALTVFCCERSEPRGS